MAVSGNTQRGLYGDHASFSESYPTLEEASRRAHQLRETGLYRRVERRRWNSGSRAQPLWAWLVLAWRKR